MNTHLGILAKNVEIVMKLLVNVYMVGASELGIVNATMTTRNFPKPPSGDKTAATSPPTLLPPSNPASHDGVNGADAAKTAPKQCAVYCSRVSTNRFMKYISTHTGDKKAEICIEENAQPKYLSVT